MATTTDERGQDATPERLRARNPIEFVEQVRAEGRRVSWATFAEVRASTIMVAIMVGLATLFFALVDWILSSLVQYFLV